MMTKKFIELKSSYDKSFLNIDSIDSVTLHKSEYSYVICVSGKWLSCNETYETEVEAKNRLNEILNMIEGESNHG